MTLTPEDRARIEAQLLEGKSVRSIARDIGCGKSSVYGVARAAGISATSIQTANAAAVRRDYHAAERVRLLNEGFARVEEMLERVGRTNELKDWAITLAVLIDKRRLEDGDVTARTEVTGEDAREQLVRRIGELAARRRAS